MTGAAYVVTGHLNVLQTVKARLISMHEDLLIPMG